MFVEAVVRKRETIAPLLEGDCQGSDSENVRSQISDLEVVVEAEVCARGLDPYSEASQDGTCSSRAASTRVDALGPDLSVALACAPSENEPPLTLNNVMYRRQ